jgi:hypothetical protein
MLAADTVADLVTAVLVGSPTIVEPAPQVAAAPGEGVAAPGSARSLVEVRDSEIEGLDLQA